MARSRVSIFAVMVPLASSLAGAAVAQGTTVKLPDVVISNTRQPDILGGPVSYGVAETSVATKTRTPIIQTPVSVQAVTHQVIEDQQAVTIDTALQNVSGVSTITNGGPQQCFQIRGFTTCDYYLNGVRVRNNFSTPQRDLADIQQIDVLKGPASILYGRQEPGGLINLETKEASSVPSYSVEQQAGSYNFYRTVWNATGPVTSDKSLLYRFDGAYQTANSFRDFDHSNHVFLAPRLHWEPSADTRFNFYFNYLHDRTAIDSIIPIVGNMPASVPISRNYGSPDAALHTKYDVRVGFNWTHDFNNAWSLTHRFDADFRDVPGLDTEPFSADCSVPGCRLSRFVTGFTSQKTQDYYTSLDLNGRFQTFGLRHDLLVGADYVASRYDTSTAFASSNVPSTYVFTPVSTGNLGYLLSNPDSFSVGNTGENWYGIYLQDQIALPYNFRLLAGFRYDNAETYSNALNLVPAPVTRTSSTVKADAVKPRVGLLWQPIPQLSLYGDYVENFGIANPQNPTQAPLPPSSARQVEAGVKVKLLDDRLLATAAYFDIVKTNVATPDPNIALASQGFQVATGAVRNKGVEFDVQGQLTPEIKVIGSYANIDSKITADNSGDIGNRLYGVPRNAGSLWAVYSPSWEGVRGVSVGAGFISRSSTALDNSNTVILPGYTTLNLMARYTRMVARTRLTFQVNAYNVTDTRYYQAENTGTGALPGTPRTILGSIKAEF